MIVDRVENPYPYSKHRVLILVDLKHSTEFMARELVRVLSSFLTWTKGKTLDYHYDLYVVSTYDLNLVKQPNIQTLVDEELHAKITHIVQAYQPDYIVSFLSWPGHLTNLSTSQRVIEVDRLILGNSVPYLEEPKNSFGLTSLILRAYIIGNSKNNETNNLVSYLDSEVSVPLLFETELNPITTTTLANCIHVIIQRGLWKSTIQHLFSPDIKTEYEVGMFIRDIFFKEKYKFPFKKLDYFSSEQDDVYFTLSTRNNLLYQYLKIKPLEQQLVHHYQKAVAQEWKPINL